MVKFDRAELLEFVRAMDRNLDGKAEVWIIGGAAAAIEHGALKRTSDIDVILAIGADIGSAAVAAVAETGLIVHVSGVTVATMPDGFEARMRPARGLRLRNLTLMVPDKYDLVLSKIAADRPHDLDVVEEICNKHHLSFTTLKKRFEEEVWNVSASGSRNLALSFVVAVARLYDQDLARQLAEKYGVPSPSLKVRK